MQATRETWAQPAQKRQAKVPASLLHKVLRNDMAAFEQKNRSGVFQAKHSGVAGKLLTTPL